MQRFYFTRLLAAGTLLAGTAACGAAQPATGGAVPGGAMPMAARPLAAVTPPVTAPVTIPYPFTNTWKTTTWSGPSAKPKTKPGSESGKIVVKFTVDTKTGVYFVPETIDSNAGYTEVLNSAITFPPYKRGTAQIILSDNFSYVQGPYTETGLDTYPQTQNSFDFPLKTGRTWSAAAAHVSSDNQTQTGSQSFQEIDSSNVAANGEYTGQTSFSSTNGSTNQDNYASTTSVSQSKPSVFTLSETAAGFNTLTQTFGIPTGAAIDVVSSGKKPVPFKTGKVRVPDWYPNGTLPAALYSDDYKVTGPATMPSECGKKWNGKPSTAVAENFSDLDPVGGTLDTDATTYYLTALAPGQYWFACIVENYTNDTYAGGWAMGPGNWGGLSSQQIGTEILIASGAKPAASDLRNIAALHVLAIVSPLAARERMMGLERFLRTR
jgi:hypothetical protein